MKFLLNLLAASAVAVLFAYILGLLGSGEFDVTQWTPKHRAGATIIILIGTPCLLFMIDEDFREFLN